MGNFAILYRANHQARPLSRLCAAPTFPTRYRAGRAFRQGRIKDLCGWLRLLVNNDDDPAFLRAATTPNAALGTRPWATSLGEFASKWKVSMFEALFADSLTAALSARALGSLHEFGR